MCFWIVGRLVEWTRLNTIHYYRVAWRLLSKFRTGEFAVSRQLAWYFHARPGDWPVLTSGVIFVLCQTWGLVSLQVWREIDLIFIPQWFHEFFFKKNFSGLIFQSFSHCIYLSILIVIKVVVYAKSQESTIILKGLSKIVTVSK